MAFVILHLPQSDTPSIDLSNVSNDRNVLVAGHLFHDDGSAAGEILILDNENRDEAVQASEKCFTQGSGTSVVISRWRKAFLDGQAHI